MSQFRRDIRLSFIGRRITPIIHNLLETNPHIANRQLHISYDVMKCPSLLDNYDWDEVDPSSMEQISKFALNIKTTM